MKEEQVAQTVKSAFDLGFEVFIVPVLWVVLLIAVVSIVISAFSRAVVSTDANGYVQKRLTFDGRKGRKALITFIVGALVLAATVWTPPGHRAAIYSASGGVSSVERFEGLSFIIPVFQNANMVNVREQKYENLEVFAQTYDGLEVTAQVGVNFVVRADEAAEIFQSVGQDYKATIIEPAVLGLVKREIGLVEAEQLFFQRGDVEVAIFEALQTRLESVGIDVTFVALQDTIFDPNIVERFLAKEAARQLIVENERLASAAAFEADAVAELADGEARAIERIALAEEEERVRLGMTPAQYLMFKTWNGIVPQFWVGGEGETPFDFLVDPSALAVPVAPVEE